ncbi:MAG: PadR family transcriptional regulator [Gemmataceae bacterium]|nr:PadR family transcriptional regulator [Gemmataceae bacterium]
MATAFDMNQWTTQLRKGIVELAVLAVVRRGETYGYRVVEELRQLAGLDLSESTVYPLLARLAKENLLAVKTVPSQIGPPRRYYRLTPAGRDRLHEMTSLWATTTDTMNQLLQGDSR